MPLQPLSHLIPLKRGGGDALIRRDVDFQFKIGKRIGGVGIRINVVGLQDSGVVSTEGAGLGAEIIPVGSRRLERLTWTVGSQ